MKSSEKISTRSIGAAGEQLAEIFLKRLGYRILDANVHKRLGEIDLIARDPATCEIVFVEVKMRKNADFGRPEAFVNHRKLLKIQKTALLWLKANHLDDQEVRVDVVGIESSSPPKLTHLKSVTQG